MRRMRSEDLVLADKPDASSEKDKPLLAIVIPAFNEGDTIEETIQSIQRGLEELRQTIETCVIVIDDGSTDATGELAHRAGADKIIRHKTNLGLGAAVRSGLSTARALGADLVVKFDADLQHEISDIIALLEPILNDEADIVYGNRFKRIDYKMPFVRRVGNIAFTRLMRWLTGWPLKDSQPGILAVNKHYLERFYLPGDYNYTQQILLDAYHKGMRFAHVPVHFHKREKGASFVSFKYPLLVVPQIIAVLVGVKPLKIFGSIGFLFLLLAGVIFSWEFFQWLIGSTEKPVMRVNLVLGMGLFGIQTLFFGLIADLIVKTNRK